MNSNLSKAMWFKSSYSGPERDCVEAAFLGGDMVGVRDSKDPTGPALIFSPSEWDAFTASVRSGKLEQS